MAVLGFIVGLIALMIASSANAKIAKLTSQLKAEGVLKHDQA